MADPFQVALFLTGPIAWNAWRDANPAAIPDLSAICPALKERRGLFERDRPFNLVEADLSKSDLRFLDFASARLTGACLAHADLSHSRLDGCDLTGADCRDALFEGSSLRNVKLTAALLSGADLSQAKDLTQAQVALANGDGRTALPEGLAPPDAWYRNSSAPTAGRYGYNGSDLLYRLLGVGPHVQEGVIHRAFLEAAKVLHPDRRPNEFGAQEAFKVLAAAADLLLDPVQRERYDRGEIDAKGQSTSSFLMKAASPKGRIFTVVATFSLTLAACLALFLTAPWKGLQQPPVAVAVKNISHSTGEKAVAVETKSSAVPQVMANSGSDASQPTPLQQDRIVDAASQEARRSNDVIAAIPVSATETLPPLEKGAVVAIPDATPGTNADIIFRYRRSRRSRQIVSEAPVLVSAAPADEAATRRDDSDNLARLPARGLDDVESLINRGNAFDERGDSDAAMRDYDRALFLDQNNTFALYNRGVASARKNDLANALSDFDKAIRDTFSEAWLYDTRGVVWCQKEQFDRAIADFTHALRVDPAVASVYRHRALALAARRRFDEALADIDHAIELQPDFAWGYGYRALIYAFMSRQQEARSDLERARALSSGDPALKDFEAGLTAAADISVEAANKAAGIVRQAAFQAQVTHRAAMPTRVGATN